MSADWLIDKRVEILKSLENPTSSDETINDLRDSGMTILYTTHYMEEAERLCHRVAIMDGGQIIALDTPESCTGKARSF